MGWKSAVDSQSAMSDAAKPSIQLWGPPRWVGRVFAIGFGAYLLARGPGWGWAILFVIATGLLTAWQYRRLQRRLREDPAGTVGRSLLTGGAFFATVGLLVIGSGLEQVVGKSSGDALTNGPIFLAFCLPFGYFGLASGWALWALSRALDEAEKPLGVWLGALKRDGGRTTIAAVGATDTRLIAMHAWLFGMGSDLRAELTDPAVAVRWVDSRTFRISGPGGCWRLRLNSTHAASLASALGLPDATVAAKAAAGALGKAVESP
jgi:hypothetical protein